MTDADPSAPERPPEQGPRWSPVGYLDAASGLPLHPTAAAARAAVGQDGWADPARPYAAGRRARVLLDAARASVAGVLGARPDEVSFTSSGTSAIHLGVLGLARGRVRVGDRVVVSAVEHSAVLHAARAVASDDGLVTVPVGGTGRVDLDAFTAAVGAPGVALAALQSANHEVGTRQPVVEAAEACRTHDVPLLVDAAASVGRLPVPAGWDVLAASAHKWGGPAGIGVLAVRTGVRWRSPSPDDPREGGRVPGFPDVVGAVAAATALEAVTAERERTAARLSALVDRVRRTVPDVLPDVEVVGDPVDRLPHIVTFSCLYVDGETMLSAFDRAGFAVSSGSACVADALVPSHVLAAMGVLTHGNVRVSLPYDVTDDEVERFLAALPGIVSGIRADAGVVGL